MSVNNTPLPERLLLFDGVCNLCDRSVQFIIRHDPKRKFRFASLQSDYAQNVLSPDRITPSERQSTLLPQAETAQFRTIVFILHGKAYTRSTAIIKVMRELGFPWSLLTAFYAVPRSLRDKLYNFIASRRYRWYGKKDSCLVPSAELRDRFME